MSRGEIESYHAKHLEWEGVKYPLSYEFEPTSERDGVTLNVPLMALRQIPARRLEWLVPGLLRETSLSPWEPVLSNPMETATTKYDSTTGMGSTGGFAAKR